MTIRETTEADALVDAHGDPIFDGEPPRHTRRPSRRQLAVGAAVIVAAGGASLGTWLGTRPSSASTTSPISVSTETVSVTTGTIKQTVSASGTLAPAQDTTLSFGVSGTVTAVDVVTGQKVTTGQTLATINSTALADTVAADQATLTAAQDRLATDQANSASTSQIDTDEAQITSAQANLTTAQTNLGDATLKATFNGTVAAVDLAVGNQVSGGGSGGSGSAGSGGSGGSGASSFASASSSNSSSSSSTSGITVISADSYTVTTSVDDTEVGDIKVGDQAVISLSGTTGAAAATGVALRAGGTGAGGTGAGGTGTTGGSGASTAAAGSGTIYGVVESVSLIAASSGSSVASFPVVIAVTGTPAGLYAGASASVSIITKQLTNVVEVPTAAVSYTTGNPTVTRVVDGKNVSTPVTTGASASGEIQITSGLSAGDKIVERVVKFNTTAGSGARSLFGGSTTGRGGAGGAGGFGTGRFGGGGGFARAGGGG